MAAATNDDERRVAPEQAGHVADEADEEEEEVTPPGILSKYVEIFNEILFIMVSCRVIPAVLEWTFLVLEDIQFASGVFPAKGNQRDQGFPLPSSMRIMFSFAKSDFVSYSEYVGAFVFSCIGLSVYYLNGTYVGYKVNLGQYPEGALYSLRILSSCNFLMLPFLRNLFSAFNCNFSTDKVLRSVTNEVVSCLSVAQIGIQCVSILFLAPYLIMTCSIALKYVDFDPTYKKPSSRVHGRCDAAHIAVKVVWVVFTGLLNDSVISGIIVSIVCSGFMAYLFDHYRPHYNANVNFLRFACHSSAAVFGTLVGFFRLANTGATGASTTLIMSLTALAFILSWKLSAWRYRKRLADVPRRLQELETLRGFRKANYLVFDSWTTVEISCRVITEAMNDRRRAFDPSKANQVYAIFRQGIVEFPRSPVLHFSFHLYSTFMSAAGCGEEYPLEETKELNRGFDVMFFAYVTERMNATREQMTEVGQDRTLSVTKFAEYTRLETSARVNHNRARKFLMMFWHTISKIPEDKETLSMALSDIQEAANEAERSYRMLLDMYPGSAAINRAFASFLVQIKNEKEAADPYIEQADLLEDAAALQHRKALDTEAERGQVRGPQPASSKFGSLAHPGATRESHEKRSRAARAASYGSSASGPGNQRAILIQQMSMPGRVLLKRLHIRATACCAVTVALQSWLFGTVSNVLRGESTRQDYRRVLTSCQFNLARIFQTTRLMTLAVLRNDTAEFTFQKGRLAEATATLRQSIRKTYTEALTNAPALSDLMVVPSMSEELRTFPTNITVNEPNALYFMTEKYANKAALLLDRDPARFSDALMSNEINYRYIRENYLTLQAGLTTASNHYKEGLSAEMSTIYREIWVCCAVTTLVVALSMVSMVRWVLREMHAYHMQRIGLLTRIPKATRKSIRDSYDTSRGNGPNVKLTDVLPKVISPLQRLRIRGVAIAVLYATLTWVFGYLAFATLREVSLGASAIEPQTKLLTNSLVLDLMVTELEFQKTPDTWPDPSSILAYFDETLNALETSITSFVYNRQSTMANSEAIVTLWFGPACLIGNSTQCAATEFSPAVSFTPKAVSSGLGTLLFQYINAGQGVLETAKLGNLTSEYAPGKFIHLAGREHLTGGLNQLYTNGRLAVLTYIAQQANSLLWLFSVLTITAVGGFRLMSGRMSSWFRGKDRATDAVFLSLAPSVIKSDKVLQVYFKTGEIMDVPVPPDRGGGGIKKGPRAAGKGKEKTLGAAAGIEQNITAPVRRKHIATASAKGGGGAPDKRLQFS